VVEVAAIDVNQAASEAAEAPPTSDDSPGLLLQVTSLLGVPLELTMFLATSPLLGMLAPVNPHPVLVLPGFMGDDLSTLQLRALINGWGYQAFGWGARANPGPTPEALATVERRLTGLFAEVGEKISIVGWSAGGRYARHLAREHPEKVRQVITLATPLQFRMGIDRSSISFIVDQVKHRFDPEFGRIPENELGVLPVPATSIYSRMDGVVPWRSCLDVVDDTHENVEIFASHVGIGFSPSAVYVIADRLSQPEGSRRPFTIPDRLARFYPSSPRRGDGARPSR
jgi:pimeloyl-ACP methyl ester carboxylesterase